ncbi:MAG: hypothetical protein FJ288_09620 [Planctomycetes bacterium]|nr:hypothetical protein [Planctomycetota bacterium]
MRLRRKTDRCGTARAAMAAGVAALLALAAAPGVCGGSAEAGTAADATRPAAASRPAAAALAADASRPAAAESSNAEAIAGTWVLQQASSRAELDGVLPKTLGPALKTPHVRGFCLRVPWKAADEDFALLEAGLAIARGHGVSYSVRFMAGRHTPARVFDKGCRFYLAGRGGQEKVPVPFLADGSPNAVFEEAYDAHVGRLAAWCRANGVRLLHLAWYGQDWAELNHGKEVRAQAGYSYENWLRAHLRLIDIGLKYGGKDLAVELPFSGHGPLTEAGPAFADHVIGRAGPCSTLFFCQANGWGPGGDWGAPTAETEAAFDRIWRKPICRGQQAIQPQDYQWADLYRKLYENRATYCEVYAPSFTLQHKADLAEEIRKFAEHVRAGGPPMPERPR